MKKTVSIMMAVLMLACMLCTTGCKAQDEIPEDAIYVSVALGGELKLVRCAVTLTDADGDGANTLNDALLLAHDAAYEGGAAAGFASEETEYGQSLTCLWGDESGAYGYCVNDASAMSLLDSVKVGDHVYAYVYADQMGWSDVYGSFDVSTAELEKGGELTLVLTYSGYDAAWNPVTAPVANACITIDGQASEYTTDAQGKVTLSFEKKGSYIVSATSDALTLVPPVCVVNVNS